MLSHTEFEDLLDLHGADLTRWPAHLAAQAGMLLGASATARAVWADAEMAALTLDALYPEARFDPARLAATVARAKQTPQPQQPASPVAVVLRGPWRRRVDVMVRAGALAAALVLGATLGWNAADHSAGSPAMDLAELIDFDGGGL